MSLFLLVNETLKNAVFSLDHTGNFFMLLLSDENFLEKKKEKGEKWKEKEGKEKEKKKEKERNELILYLNQAIGTIY